MEDHIKTNLVIASTGTAMGYGISLEQPGMFGYIQGLHQPLRANA
jgi:hypothetical protein